ncbi:MAG: hypothetical protein ACO29C_07985, partial [Fluviibacter sp.]
MLPDLSLLAADLAGLLPLVLLVAGLVSAVDLALDFAGEDLLAVLSDLLALSDLPDLSSLLTL